MRRTMPKHGENRKSAVRISSVDRLDVHKHILKTGFQEVWNFESLQLNHYRLMSKEYFEKTKMIRGDVSKSRWDNMRTWDYFEANDKCCSDVADVELCSILGCCAS